MGNWICEACLEGKHDECIDIGEQDGYPMCSCVKGDCVPQLSYACAEWLHNCAGCPCSCHQDPDLHEAWKKVHAAWVEQRLTEKNRRYGPVLHDAMAVSERTADT